MAVVDPAIQMQQQQTNVMTWTNLLTIGNTIAIGGGLFYLWTTQEEGKKRITLIEQSIRELAVDGGMAPFKNGSNGRFEPNVVLTAALREIRQEVNELKAFKDQVGTTAKQDKARTATELLRLSDQIKAVDEFIDTIYQTPLADELEKVYEAQRRRSRRSQPAPAPQGRRPPQRPQRPGILKPSTVSFDPQPPNLLDVDDDINNFDGED